jgi:hypothetical protein
VSLALADLLFGHSFGQSVNRPAHRSQHTVGKASSISNNQVTVAGEVLITDGAAVGSVENEPRRIVLFGLRPPSPCASGLLLIKYRL